MSETRRPPGPDGLPVLGSTIPILRDQLSFNERCASEYGDLAATTVAGDCYTMVSHPDYIERVLVTDVDDFEKGAMVRDRLSGLAADSLLLKEGDEWRWLRKLMQPSFTHEQIQQYTNAMARVIEDHVANWIDGEELDLWRETQRLSIHLLARTLFGPDIDDEMETIREAVQAISTKFDSSNPSVFLPDWVPTPTNRRYRRGVADLDRLIDGLIADRRADPEGYDDLLARLLAAEHDGQTLDDGMLIDNTKGLLLAGTDTTATAMTFACWLLATHPDAQKRLHADIDGVLDDKKLTAADLFALTEPKRALKEAMRLYPPTPTIFREARTEVEVGSYTIPAGTNVALSQWVVHRDERWYDAPKQFRPGRWTDDFEQELHEYAYFPFGGGSRHCLGMRFAMTEMQLVLAVAVREFTLESVTTSVDVSGGMTLSTAEPIRVRIRRR